VKRRFVFFSGLMVLCFLLPNNAQAGAIREAKSREQNGMNALSGEIPPLKGAYRALFLLGNVISPGDLGTPRFLALRRHFDVLTAENAMKPLYLQREKGEFSFDDADKLVDAALAAGLKIHGHTLAWHQQSPGWMNYDGISRNEAIENLENHAKTVAAHFKGRVISWDVLNEAIMDNPPNPQNWRASLRQCPWLNAIGPDYVELVFRAAREADPAAVLYYNDYNLDNRNKAAAVYNMVNELNEKYRASQARPLIDGIGMQGHYRISTNIDNVAASLGRFASLGLEVSITELDVLAGASGALSEAQALEQGAVYARLFSLFSDYADNIGRVTIWGLDDGKSWRGTRNPTLFDRNLDAKPAFFAALAPEQFLAENESKITTEVKTAAARYGTPQWGNFDDPLWDKADDIAADQLLLAWQGATGLANVLWDEQYLYVRVTVRNAVLNKANSAAHEQDSVEVFIDENNQKSTLIQDDDAQLRVNFDNERSFREQRSAEGFESAARVADNAYTVLMKIPFRTVTPRENMLIGFEVQINGASERGFRQNVAVWNDVSGMSYQDTSGYGNLVLTR